MFTPVEYFDSGGVVVVWGECVIFIIIIFFYFIFIYVSSLKSSQVICIYIAPSYIMTVHIVYVDLDSTPSYMSKQLAAVLRKNWTWDVKNES